MSRDEMEGERQIWCLTAEGVEEEESKMLMCYKTICKNENYEVDYS